MVVMAEEETKLRYSSTFSNTATRILEVSEDLLEHISNGGVHVKLDKTGVASLCGSNDSFTIRQVDNSNTQLFVLPRMDARSEIVCSASGLIKVDKIYSRSIPDNDISEVFARYDKVENILPYLAYSTIWSEAKILKHLRSHSNYYIDNNRHWRMLSDIEVFGQLDQILNVCAIIGSSGNNEFNSEEVWTSLSEVSESEVSMTVVQYLLSRLSPDDSQAFQNKGESEWPLKIVLDSEKLVIHRGRQVLFTRLASRPNVNLDRFLVEWKQVLETTVLIDACLIDDSALVGLLPGVISGRAVIDDDLLIGIDSRFLSIQVEKRMIELFKTKPKWHKSEFESFISPLLPEDVKPETVLLKSCRLDQCEESGEMVYSSKFDI